MEDEIISEVENHKVDKTELDAELGEYDIDQFLVNEFEKLDEIYEQLEYKYHGLKAARKVKYGT